jgi:hypothetical protein
LASTPLRISTMDLSISSLLRRSSSHTFLTARLVLVIGAVGVKRTDAVAIYHLHVAQIVLVHFS